MRRPRYELSEAARLDLLEAWNYLQEHASIDVADRIIADIEAAIGRVVRAAGIGHRRRDLTSRDLWFYRVHAYLIVYRKTKRPLHVVRILHAARDVEGVLEEDDPAGP